MTASDLSIATEQQGKMDARHSARATPFQLAGWVVEPALNKLHNPEAGTRHLEPRLMKLLCYLAANQGTVLSRDELVSELWPHVIVNENSLTRAVSELRKHLAHASVDTRDLIQTVPKRGYLLSQVITELSAESAGKAERSPAGYSDSPAEQPAASLTAVNRPVAFALHFLQQPLAAASTAAALSICLTLVSGFNFNTTEAVDASLLVSLQDEVISSDKPLYGAEISLSSAWSDTIPAGTIEKPAMAADGERFAFIKHDISGSAIYLGELESEDDPVVVFQGPCKISNLTWSPLGDALLFARDPNLTPAVLFNSQLTGQQQRELFSLNLKTLDVSRLVEDKTPSANDEAPTSSLTFQPAEELTKPAGKLLETEPV